MTQKEKQLLLIDLSARLHYGVMCHANEINLDGELLFINKVYNIVALYNDKAIGKFNTCPIADITPYLRPMSSMTEEEKKELKTATCPEGTGYFNEQYLICPMSHFCEHISYDFMSDILNWLNAHHFDYRGLIEKGLAIEVTRDNNPYEKKV